MTWKRVVAVSGLTGISGALSSAVAGNLLVRWYDFNALEGAPEFFVVVFALAGLIVGGLAGIVVSLLLAAVSRFSLAIAAFMSSALMLLLVAVSTGISGLLADIPPEINGQQLFLAVELRFPSRHASPSSMPGFGYLKLGATGIGGVRKQETGLLHTEDAQLVDGQWTAPGIVRIFTSRGRRRIEAGIGTSPLVSFDVPVPAYPPAESGEWWSEWLPRLEVRERASEQFTYRYKIVRESWPLRVESFGRLTIETSANQGVLRFYDARRHRNVFYTARSSERVSVISEFRILHGNYPLPGFERVEAIAVLKRSSPTALLVHAARGPGSTPCYLLVDDGSKIDVRPFGNCDAPIVGSLLTSDPREFAAAHDIDRGWGWVDRSTFAVPGLFLVDGNVLDTRNLTVMRIDLPPGAGPRGSPPPLSLSPDERSFVWFDHRQPNDRSTIANRTTIRRLA
jgi:hypothetical protein